MELLSQGETYLQIDTCLQQLHFAFDIFACGLTFTMYLLELTKYSTNQVVVI